jgi:hypothetical protein
MILVSHFLVFGGKSTENASGLFRGDLVHVEIEILPPADSENAVIRVIQCQSFFDCDSEALGKLINTSNGVSSDFIAKSYDAPVGVVLFEIFETLNPFGEDIEFG